MSTDGFIEQDDTGNHIKIDITPAIRDAAEKVVDAYTDLKRFKNMHPEYNAREFARALSHSQLHTRIDNLGHAVANLRGAVHKDNPELPEEAFGVNPKTGDSQRLPSASHRLRRDMRLAVNDTLNVLLKEIADDKGVEAPVLDKSIPLRKDHGI